MMTDTVFNQRYSIKKLQSNNFADLKPIRLFIHEICCCDPNEVKEALKFARIVEKDLIDNNILEFKVEDYWDINKIDPNTDSGFIQWCIWNLLSK